MSHTEKTFSTVRTRNGGRIRNKRSGRRERSATVSQRPGLLFPLGTARVQETAEPGDQGSALGGGVRFWVLSSKLKWLY